MSTFSAKNLKFIKKLKKFKELKSYEFSAKLLDDMLTLLYRFLRLFEIKQLVADRMILEAMIKKKRTF
jgi:hypothetical protein